MPTPRSPFVEDLVPIILESNLHWWTRDYTRLAQVSSSWLYYVRKRLYSCPTLYSFNSCSLLANTLQRNPSLVQLVKGIELRPTLGGSRDEAVASCEHLEGILVLLGLEGLERLVIGGELAQQAERFLNALVAPETIVELAIEGQASLNPGSGSLEVDESFFYRFSNLKSLKLANLELDLVPPPMPLAIPINLNRVILHEVDIARGGSLFQLFAGAALESLSVQTSSPQDYDELLKAALTECQIVSLNYSVGQSCGPGDQSFLDVELGTSRSSPLQSLHLDGQIVDQTTLSALAQCHQSLGELGVGGRLVRITAQEWIAFVNSGALPRLQKLIVPAGTNEPPFCKWEASNISALQSACASKQIDLVCC